MNLWIVTIGSSDVQLASDRVNQEKGRTEQQRSDKAWNYWYTDELRADCYDIEFVPKSLFKDKDEPYRVAPRILGRVYNASPAKVQQEIWNYLTFPLLDNFLEKLAHYPAPEAIAILLTNQSAIFEFDRQRRKPNCPYWQDTCELEPILESYFQKNFPSLSCNWLILDPPSSEPGLDHWDFALNLVRRKFKTFDIVGKKSQVEPYETVYVSHQAGTPAISSAVQFVSLSTFGDRVKFLVSNEQDKTLTGIVESSAYLRGIKREQAKKLLDRHDYSGIKTVIDTYLDNETQILLEAAIQWNFAKFDEFAAKIKSSSSNQTLVQQVEERSQHWWWTAYESAFLGVVRLKQGNTVEAMFHSFRAVEGLLRQWIDEHDKSLHNAGKPKLQKNGNGKIQLPRPVKFKTQKGEEKEITTANPYGQGLYFVLDSIRGIKREQDIDIWTFGNSVFYCRNNLFHQLEGLQDKEAVFREWDTTDEQSWKNRVINCLNFVSGKQYQFSDNDNSNEHAISLMVRVHQELETAIAQL